MKPVLEPAFSYGEARERALSAPSSPIIPRENFRGQQRSHSSPTFGSSGGQLLMRIGHGYDSHRFERGRRLILGGVEIPSELGLTGHSDADAVAHAVTDALLGAAGLGDIGTHFPPSDDQWRDADSIGLLVRSVALVEAENYQVVNVDVTVIAEHPRVGPYAEAMRTRIADAIGISPRSVSIKAKSNEGMGWIGAREGIAVHAVALIDRIEDQDRVHARHAPELPRL